MKKVNMKNARQISSEMRKLHSEIVEMIYKMPKLHDQLLEAEITQKEANEIVRQMRRNSKKVDYVQ